MITSMSDILCVSNRRLCGCFPAQLERIAAAHPAAIILREKDLTELEYEKLAEQVLTICQRYGTPLILHSFPAVALRLGISSLHLPLPLLRKLSPEERSRFSSLGTSCHCVEEAQEGQALGCTYLTAGHIFPTDCKRGLTPRGLTFLASVCQSVSLPVYAIGGISPDNIQSVYQAGAKGACLMSGLMKHPDPAALLGQLERVL